MTVHPKIADLRKGMRVFRRTDSMPGKVLRAEDGRFMFSVGVTVQWDDCDEPTQVMVRNIRLKPKVRKYVRNCDRPVR